MRIINADQLEGKMYHEAFENDVSYDERNPMARWDSGLWIRYKMFENCLENTPTIDAAPVKHGKWLISEYEYYDCSVCGESYFNGCDSTQEAKERLLYRPYDVYKYCPHCGAKMDQN